MMEVYFPRLFEHLSKVLEQNKPPYKDGTWIVFDFDGVCSQYRNGWEGADVFDEPVPGVPELTIELRQKGFKTLLATVREDTPKLQAYLKEHGFEFDAVNSANHNPDDAGNFKPMGELYIDDKAVHFDPESPGISIEKIRSRLGIGEAKESKEFRDVFKPYPQSELKKRLWPRIVGGIQDWGGDGTKGFGITEEHIKDVLTTMALDPKIKGDVDEWVKDMKDMYEETVRTRAEEDY